jgi:hypothetical protein
MMKQYAVQTISRRLLGSGADESDLPWEAIPGHGDYPALKAAWDAAEEFDLECDHRYAHRVIEVEVESPAPAPVATPEPAPVKPAALRRQYAEHKNQQAFARCRDLLKLEISMGSARRHLDPLLELCRVYLMGAGASVLTNRYKLELAQLHEQVTTRGNLRVIK